MKSVKKHVIVGVTGHRILTELDKIVSGIDQALDKIEEAFPSRSMLLLSPLAEGADRIVANRILMHRGGRLIVPLSECRDMNFTNPDSKKEFQDLLDQADEVVRLPPAGSRAQAYAAEGRYVLSHCDVLVAVWDGKSAQGEGGTGMIVGEARQQGLSVAWVHAGNRKPGTLEPTSLGEEQGKVTFERLS